MINAAGSSAQGCANSGGLDRRIAAAPFTERMQDALRRRLYPNTSLHAQQLAAAIGKSGDTVLRWWKAHTAMPAWALDELHAFFSSQGDAGFLNEVFGLAAEDRLARLERQHQELGRELAALRAQRSAG